MSNVPTIALLPLPNFTLNAFASLIDVLRLAADEGDRSRPVRLAWNIVSPTRASIKASCGVSIEPWELLGSARRFDYVIVCGGLLRRSHEHDETVQRFLSEAHDAGATIIGLCTGSFAMAQAGLLNGRKACVSWFHLRDFQREFPDVEVSATELFVVDGNCITCAGGAGAADVSAWIVERHAGPAAARKALHIMQIDAPRAADAPQPQPALVDGVQDQFVGKAILMIEERLDRNLPVSLLARAVGISRRQLERRFLAETGHSPASFATMLRVRYADWLIATTDKSMTAIAISCGFADPAHFSRRYKAAFGSSPTTAREKHRLFMENERRPYQLSE